ncbi:hypothetical protein [Nitrosopumilus ureiphilus]|uniref:Uncharacterized protein n=1 Tax=Nitrosopumilus ureiphilus TaxID=1470067 RepID=A0A7D5M4X5_9ARCH|nr:hypothetical protein [Nitrosopumilus ureiphilus]QLH06653.1 hypothetical protein C5F50_05875 [Nitrosopumilus ureiphilus]
MTTQYLLLLMNLQLSNNNEKMKTRHILIPIVIFFIIVGLMTYFDYSKLTTPINGIPIEEYCDQFPNPFCTERPLDLDFFEYLRYKISSWNG